MAAVRCARERDRLRLREDGREAKYLVFRAFSVENGQEDLAVSILALGELEGGKDLSERWRCCLWRVKGQHAQRDAERGRERQTCSRTLLEESIRCWEWAVEFMGVEGRADGGRGGERGDRYMGGRVSKYKYAKWEEMDWVVERDPSHRRCSGRDEEFQGLILSLLLLASGKNNPSPLPTPPLARRPISRPGRLLVLSSPRYRSSPASNLGKQKARRRGQTSGNSDGTNAMQRECQEIYFKPTMVDHCVHELKAKPKPARWLFSIRRKGTGSSHSLLVCAPLPRPMSTSPRTSLCARHRPAHLRPLCNPARDLRRLERAWTLRSENTLSCRSPSDPG